MKSMTLLLKLFLVLTVTACGFWPSNLSSLLDADTPGACAREDGNFSSEEGGCLQFSTGQVFSLARSEKVSYADAITYCANLNEGGFDSWTLPSRSVLVEAARPERARTHFPFRVSDFFWSSTGNIDTASIVDLLQGEATSIPTRGAEARVVCTRQPADSDRDGVPDSSDLCQQTPAQTPRSAVATTGARKGCTSDEIVQLRIFEGTCSAGGEAVGISATNWGTHYENLPTNLSVPYSCFQGRRDGLTFADAQRFCSALSRMQHKGKSTWQIPSFNAHTLQNAFPQSRPINLGEIWVSEPGYSNNHVTIWLSWPSDGIAVYGAYWVKTLEYLTADVMCFAP